MAGPIIGRLCIDGWAGFHVTRVYVVGQTPKRLRIRAITRTKLGGRSRWLEPGQEALVPAYAVRDNCVECDGARGGIPGNENIINGKQVCDYCHARRTGASR